MSSTIRIPWYLKILIKLIVARIPLSHKTWYRFGLFKHGKMQDFAYAHRVFTSHIRWAGLLEQDKNAEKTLLELGPGESLYTTLLAKAYGFNRVILLDVSIFALPALDGYKEFERWLASQGLHCPSIKDCASFEEMLSVLNAQYLTRGLDSLRDLPDNYVDFVFSQAVMEHIRKNQFAETAQELWRILKPGGVSTHEIDFRDHLEASLNNLRFSKQVWEAEWMASSGFYTNRIRLCQMLEIFKEQGFEVTLVDKKEWAILPINKKYLQPEFQTLSDINLLTNVAVIHLYKSL